MSRSRRSRLLLVGLPVFAVFAAFGAIVWLAYQHGADVPPVGEPPLIKAPATALKLPPGEADEAGSSEVADQGEVRDLLTDTPPSGQLERLLPSPEEPLTPEVATQTPAPTETAAADQAPPAPTPPTAELTPPARPASPPAQAALPPTPAPPPPAQAALPPTPSPSPPAQAASPPAPAPSPPAQVAPAPAQAAPPPQIAAKPAEPPRQAPSAVERQSAEASPPASTVQQSPREAEAALDALLAEVTESARPPAPPPSSSAAVPPRPPVASPAAPTTSTAALNPASRPVQPAPQTPPAAVGPLTQPGGQITAIAPDRPGPRPSGAGAGAPPTSEPAPGGKVAALEGAYRIQLAAVRDEADARRAWDLFLIDLGPVLKGVQPFIERAATANGVFYRVQVGPFASLPEAESLCDQLKQRNASCFVIRR